MLIPFRRKLMRLMIGSVIASTMVAIAFPGRTQSAGDIIVIGDSPTEWSEFQTYWNQLIDLNAPPAPAEADQGDVSFEQGSADPQRLQEELIKNLRVSQLKLKPIIKLNGSSQVTGLLTNRNQEAVTVASVNFEVLDPKGKLVQTGSARPEPSTIGPGESVTFQKELPLVPPDGGYKIKLSKTPFVIQGGI